MKNVVPSEIESETASKKIVEVGAMPSNKIICPGDVREQREERECNRKIVRREIIHRATKMRNMIEGAEKGKAIVIDWKTRPKLVSGLL